MYKREHHLRIATVLQSIDANVLDQHKCFFGGGTAIVLLHNEYRESVDIDFLISDRLGYQNLRQLISSHGLHAITRKGTILNTARDVRIDQYGIRTMLLVADTEIKLEIIFESRISIQDPKKDHRICGLKTLTPIDMAACKLLANSDRWNDDSVFSRDLIDLSMLQLSKKNLKKAIDIAANAYGASIERDLKKAIDSLKKRNGRLDECISALKIDHIPKALLWSYIKKLI